MGRNMVPSFLIPLKHLLETEAKEDEKVGFNRCGRMLVQVISVSSQ